MKVLVFTLLTLSFYQPLFSWQLAKQDGNVLCYTRNVEDSMIPEYKVETTIEAPLRTIIAVMEDEKSASDWLPRCRQLKVLRKLSEQKKIIYRVYDFQWPIRDRDSIETSTISQDMRNKQVVIRRESRAEYLPPFPGIIRIEKSRSLVKLTPINAKEVKLEWIGHEEIGGNLPLWLKSMMAVDQPTQTVINLREMVKKEHYKKVKDSFIREK